MKTAAAIVLTFFLAFPTNQTVPDVIQKTYLELLETKDIPKLSPGQIKSIEGQNSRERKAEETRLKKQEDRIQADLKAARKQLETLNKKASQDTAEATAERTRLHCEVVRLESELAKTRTEREKGLPVLYQNRSAKLELIQKWPAIRARIETEMDRGTARQRKYGDVDDIGVRDLGIEDLAEKQQRDIRIGKETIEEMKSQKLMPPEIDDKQVSEYVRKLAEHISSNSDLKVPIKVTVLDSLEINAFALPGGFLFVNSALIDKAETESELAGVLSHEIAHAAARHGPRLMKRARIMDLLFQMSQIGVLVMTGGAGAYGALQYGFYGVGMMLDLTLLGVNREFEAEADQLGAQYSWQAGYDPKGFITFFDKMASEKGYVKSASFFRTHPPYLDRIISTFSEITYLPAKDVRIDSSGFMNAKKRIAELVRQREKEVEDRPSLRGDLPACTESF